MSDLKKSPANRTLYDFTFWFCVAVCLFHIFITVNSSFSLMVKKSIHLCSFLLLWFIIKLNETEQGNIKKVFFTVMSLITLILGIYFYFQTQPSAIAHRLAAGVSFADLIFGIILILIILIIAHESVGTALSFVILFFIFYAFFGHRFVTHFSTQDYSLKELTEYLVWTNKGIFGTAIGAAVSFVVLYLIFGQLLDTFGVAKYFIDLSYALTGRMMGGQAEAAVLSSALMGSINGTAIANAVTAGTVTIPLMKNAGYKPEYAAAVDAASSAGCQLLPPVMGAAAFIISDTTGIHYSDIILAAILPDSPDKIGKVSTVFKKGFYHLIPLIVLLICLLGFKLSASLAAVYAIITITFIGSIRTYKNEKRLPFKELGLICQRAAKAAIPVTIACAAAGIVLGIVSMTGLDDFFSGLIYTIAHGKSFVILILSMIFCLILGMGLTSTATYIISAAIAVPAMSKAGLPLLGSHLFIFYFALISYITPPVAMAANAASSLAQTKVSKTIKEALKLGIAGFIIPYLFIYNHGLFIANEKILKIVSALALSICALIMSGAAVNGWFIVKLHLITRFFLFVSAILLIIPLRQTHLIGLLFMILTISIAFLIRRKQKKVLS